MLLSANAQFSVDTVFVQHEAPKVEGVFYSTIELFNSADTSVTVEWEVTMQDIPAGWNSTFTVGFDWYEDSILTGSYNLVPTDSFRSFAVVQFYPNNIADTGDYEIKFWLSNDTSTNFTVHFRGIAYTAPNSVHFTEQPSQIYPNPLRLGDQLHGLVGSCMVYTVEGRLLWQGNAADFDATELEQTGTYIIVSNPSLNSRQILRLVVLP
ncbi:MAG: hypothetical protein EP332_11485 [Bacteroidetes bacterium]|nr:MAG: hypothetical protein EP332_11485 [Bacteroidota bacterium]